MYKNQKVTYIFKELVHSTELTIEFIGGSFIKAHQHSTGAAGTDCQDKRKSEGGNTTNIHMSVDDNAKPTKFYLSPENVNDCTMATEIIVNLTLTKFMVADKIKALQRPFARLN